MQTIVLIHKQTFEVSTIYQLSKAENHAELIPQHTNAITARPPSILIVCTILDRQQGSADFCCCTSSRRLMLKTCDNFHNNKFYAP